MKLFIENILLKEVRENNNTYVGIGAYFKSGLRLWSTNCLLVIF